MNFQVFGVSSMIFSGFLFLGAFLYLPQVRQIIHNVDQNQRGIWKSTLNLEKYIDLCRRSNIRMLICLRVFPTYYWGSVNLLMPILIDQIGGNRVTGYYGALSLLFAFACQLVTGKICDAKGHRIPALVANIVVTLLTFGLVFFHNSLVELELFGILGAGAAWALSTTIPRFINEFTTRQEKGHGVGLTHLAWSTGFLLGYVASGYLLKISTHLPFLVAVIFLICSSSISYNLCIINSRIRKEHL